MNACELANCTYWGGTLCSNPDAFGGWSCAKKEAVVEEALQLLAETRNKMPFRSMTKEKIFINDNLLQRVSPNSVIKYLQFTRIWVCTQDNDGIKQFWRNNDTEVLVPMYPAFRVYTLRLQELLDTLSRCEGRSREEILADIMNQ